MFGDSIHEVTYAQVRETTSRKKSQDAIRKRLRGIEEKPDKQRCQMYIGR